MVDKIKDITPGKQTKDDKSKREEAYPDSDAAKKKGYYEVLSMYEKDKWTDYSVDADVVFRETDNPHKNGELPLVNKFSIPLVDDFMAMGDSERGATMQNTLNSIWALYLDAVKVSIYPPTLINKDNVADPNSIKFSAAAKWLVRNNVGNAAQVLNITPQGTNTFNNVYQVVTSSLLNMFGTSQSSTTQQTDPGFGKTPQALEMQAARENAKDNVDRFYMEQFVTKVYKRFANLISKMNTGSIQFRMFDPEIQELAVDYPEINEIYDPDTGKITIKNSKMGSVMYDYEIVSGSTYAIDQKQQQQSLMSLMTMVLNPQSNQLIQQSLQQTGKALDIGELFTRIITNSGITNWDKIIVDRNKNPDFALQDQMEQFQQILSQAGGINNIPGGPEQPIEQPIQNEASDSSQLF
jgi:hypothetical protein